ncbi:hypothetical protein [Microbacterium sp. W4I20]|uniref:hypothetical protein n=1 Tax=Microbacterium sp. W4I20 TaxID=3042262 RepID=UPI00278B51B9|nr:hypothetical protein [Microbacterium sp. W4I20]MDQ0728372.1 hypothetical protein [Microbacterium sp. W4I20]
MDSWYSTVFAGEVCDVVHQRLVVGLGVDRVGHDAEHEGVLVDRETAGGRRLVGTRSGGGVGRAGTGGETEREKRDAGEGGKSAKLHEDLSRVGGVIHGRLSHARVRDIYLT